MRLYLQRLSEKRGRVQKNRAISSAGSEHLVYTQRVGGSNPSSPTKKSFGNPGDFFYFWIMYYCYILYSERLDKYYIGSTSDLEGRQQRHNTSNKGFTSIGKPWVIKYSEQYESKIL